MVPEISLLVRLVDLVDLIPSPAPPPPRRGGPPVYSDRLFLKALVIMLAILAQPTPEMRALRARLTEGGASRPAGPGSGG